MDQHDRRKPAGSAETRQKRPALKTLFYRAVPHRPDELAFAKAAEAERVSQIHYALSTAKTWGEFKALMPAADFAEVLHSYVENLSYTEDVEDDDVIEPPSESRAFEPDCVGGFSEGDYPTWLQAEMNLIIPREILQKFGSSQSTFLSGNYWRISSDCERDIVHGLCELGYFVERRDGLKFF